jgi:hypothetical protein
MTECLLLMIDSGNGTRQDLPFKLGCGVMATTQRSGSHVSPRDRDITSTKQRPENGDAMIFLSGECKV